MATRRILLTLVVALVAAACGRIEIPAQKSPPRTVQRAPAPAPAPAPEAPAPVSAPTSRVSSTPLNTPPVTAAPAPSPVQQAQEPQSDTAFVGASAVTVGRGDTVYALSRRHKVPVQAIIRANDLDPPYTLFVGQRITLPRGRQHRIAPGDTLYSIAQRYDVGLYEMARLNNIGPPYTARLGTVLVIPDSEPAEPPVAAATPPSAPAPTPVPQPTPQAVERPDSTVDTSGRIALVPPKKPPVPVSAPPSRSGKGFVWPVRGRVVSNFGAKDGGLRNDGINIRADRGTPIVAAENGVVAYAGNEIRGFGNLLLIKHDGGYITAYAHTDQLLVTRGQKVSRGQKIATVGSTGSVSQPQLHFEVRKGRRPQDPRKYLSS